VILNLTPFRKIKIILNGACYSFKFHDFLPGAFIWGSLQYIDADNLVTAFSVLIENGIRT